MPHDNDHALPDGLYEALLTKQLEAQLHGTTREIELAKVDEADQAHVLARHVSMALLRKLASVKDPSARLSTANSILRSITELQTDPVVSPVQELHSVLPSPGLEWSPAPRNARRRPSTTPRCSPTPTVSRLGVGAPG